jgi:diguanylate cyclase (GGDEF)-like protein
MKNLGNWTWDIETNLINCSPLKTNALGYDEGEIPDRVTYAFFTEKIYIEDYPDVRDAILAIIQGESDSFDVMYRIRTKYGGFRWFQDKCDVTMRDVNGKPLIAAGITFDVTEGKLKAIEAESETGIIDSNPAYTDHLTHTLNRMGMDARLMSEIDAVRINTQFLTVALFEIDEFMSINTIEGHPFGDYVLIRTADILKDRLRETDLLGRYRVEQFMVIFPKTPKEIATSIAEAIQSDIASYAFGTDLKINIHFGIVEYLGEDLEMFMSNLEKTLSLANQGLNGLRI